MNKYLKAIKNNNDFLIDFFDKFNALLNEKKKVKGLINKELILNCYQKELFEENYKITKMHSGSSYEVERLSFYEYNKKGLYIHKLFVSISKKNPEVILECISLKNKLENNITVDYSFTNEGGKYSSNMSITLCCDISHNETSLSINDNFVKMYSSYEKEFAKTSTEYEKNKELLYKLSSLAKINTDLIIDYLLLGKTISNEQFDLFSLENDIFIDADKNIFKIDLENMNVITTNKLKIK